MASPTKVGKKDRWAVSNILIVGIATASLAFVSCTLYLVISQSDKDIGRRIMHRLVQGHAQKEALKHSRKLFCVYDVHAASVVDYDITDIPVVYCSDIVVCCIRSERFTDDQYLGNAITFLRSNVPEVRIYVGLFANGQEGSWFFNALTTTDRKAKMSRQLLLYVVENNVNGGVYVHAHDFKAQANVNAGKVYKFVKSFSESLQKDSARELIFTLPKDSNDLRKAFPARQMELLQASFVKLSHFTPPYRLQERKVPCATPYNYPGGEPTLQGVFRELNAWSFFETSNISRKVMLTLDVMTYGYVQEQEYPYLLTGRSVLPYREMCSVCSNTADKASFWKAYQDRSTLCNVAATSSGIRTSTNPKAAVEKMLDFYSHQLPGVVVFNVHQDDFTGICGSRHGFVKKVYCALESLSPEQCDRL